MFAAAALVLLVALAMAAPATAAGDTAASTHGPHVALPPAIATAAAATRGHPWPLQQRNF